MPVFLRIPTRGAGGCCGLWGCGWNPIGSLRFLVSIRLGRLGSLNEEVWTGGYLILGQFTLIWELGKFAPILVEHVRIGAYLCRRGNL